MLLVVDVGNSHTVLGLFEGEELRAHWRLVTSVHRTADEIRVFVGALLLQSGIDPRAVRGCCVSSVVPPLNRCLDEVCRGMFGAAPVMVGPGIRTGIVLQVENPKEVGADRIANAVGAVATYPGSLILVDFGTATTFDAVSDRGEYRGGVIVPGIEVSADALFDRCAKLPRVEISRPPSVIGRDTVSNIRSGLTYGYADLVDGLIARMIQEMGGRPTVVATGGLAAVIAEIAQRIDHVDPLLTLRGLRLLFEKNQRVEE